MVDTLNNQTIIHDTLYIKGAEGLDLLYKTDAFYNSAWTKLLVFWTVLAIVIPSVIVWFQNRSLKLNKADVKRDMDELFKTQNEQIQTDFDSYKKKNNLEVEAVLQAKLSAFTEKIDMKIIESKASIFYLQANHFLNDKNYVQAFKDFAHAAVRFNNANKYANLRNALFSINTHCLPNISLKEFESLRINHGIDLEKILDDVQAKDKNQFLKDIIIATKIAMGELK